MGSQEACPHLPFWHYPTLPYPDEQDEYIPSLPLHQVVSCLHQQSSQQVPLKSGYHHHPNPRPDSGHHPGIYADPDPGSDSDIAVTDTPSTLCNFHAHHIHSRLLKSHSRLYFHSRMLLLVDDQSRYRMRGVDVVETV